ncbi:MAG: hypothetical protein GY757_28470 [bacterium]|nr:hypothetical protein [bacterium]
MIRLLLQTIEKEAHQPLPQSCWALASDRLKSESYLKGHGEEAKALISLTLEKVSTFKMPDYLLLCFFLSTEGV